MAVNLSSLSSITTAATSLSNLVLVTPQQVIGYQPQTQDGETKAQPPSLVFHYEGEQTALLESDITDHFIEDNTAIQNQIALKPETITTHGFIGELNNVPPAALKLLKLAADKLTILGAYAPVISSTALIAYNQALVLYQTAENALNAGVSAWSSIAPLVGGSGAGDATISSDGLSGGVNGSFLDLRTQNRQQVMFQQFYGYWRSRTLFTVQTPWAVFQNMAIKSLRAVQDADTRVITDFEVTFKMMRFASAFTSAGPQAILQGRASAQASGVVDHGTSTPKPSIGLGTGLKNMGL